MARTPTRKYPDAAQPDMNPSAHVGRLAPSPTGALHLGNARSFLLAWLSCRSQGGRVILRMEDLDHPKVKPGAAEAAYEDLRWLGLDWDEGPHVQTGRLSLHVEALEKLRSAGLIYPCTCSRKDIEAAQSAPHAGEELRYAGTCRDRWVDEAAAGAATGRPPAWRFRVTDGAETVFTDRFLGEIRSTLSDWSGDFVVARGRDRPAYQLAVVVDDAAMGITEVLRADDLAETTHRQLVLYDALGLTPPAFIHVPLVVGPDGRRLAKRHGDTRIAHLRAEGVSATQIVGWLASTCGWAPPGAELEPRDLLPRFALETLPREQVVFYGPSLPSAGS